MNIANYRKIILGCYCRPLSDTGSSLEELNASLNRTNDHSKATIIVEGPGGYFKKSLKILKE